MKNKIWSVITLCVVLFTLIHCASENDLVYEKFLKRVQDDEPYIGFFAAEKICLSELTEDYLKARREFFLGVDKCEEDPETYMEPFLEFCKTSNLLTEDCDQNWEKTLTILSYELYGNKPIFDYKADNIIAHRNLVFAEYPNKKLMLDLFLPEKPLGTPMPVVVCVHGGGWRVNRRVWFEPFAQYLASKGIAAVTIDYRMLPAVKIIDCVYDTKAAVRWVRANADKYNIDPERIGAIGASAGAHLVALLGTTADVPEIEGTGGNSEQSSAIHAVVGIATPSFKISDDMGWIKRRGMSEEDVKMISPYENISSNSAPLYLIHGTADQTVPPGNSQELYDKYQEVGVHVELTWIPDEGHGFYEGTDIAIAMASDFFKKMFMDKIE